MTTTFYGDDESPEVFWDDLEEWERHQVWLDGYADEEEEDTDPDLYDQLEYLADHAEE